jgi:hypothetical protein
MLVGERKRERTKQEETPSVIIDTPLNYENTHELAECPISSCHSPNPHLDMYMPVRDFGYFDINLYTCVNTCACGCGKFHKFSVKHDILKDVEHLKVYDRTHIKSVWLSGLDLDLGGKSG